MNLPNPGINPNHPPEPTGCGSASTLGGMQTLAAACGSLEPQLEAHAAEMFGVLSDPAIYEFEGVPPASIEQLAANYLRKESRKSPDAREQWLNWVVRLPTGELAGYVQATVLATGASYVAYEFSSKHWRKGIASAAVLAMLGELERAYGVHTVVAVLKAANFRSMGLLRRLGFEPASASECSLYQPEADELVMLKRTGALPAAPMPPAQ